MMFPAIVSLFAGFLFSCYVLGQILPQTLLNCFTFVSQIFLCSYVSAWFLYLTYNTFFTATVSAKNKAVIITGCDSGFGKALAERLHRIGYKVYACCFDLSSDGARQLDKKCSKSLKIVRLDVTDDECIKAAKDFVVKDLKDTELWALVNNAGVLRTFAVELCPIEDFEACMNVNALGPVRVTKAFLPLLRKSKGRVVNVCSMAGRIAGPLLCAYSMSKYAAVSFTEAIRHELRDFGVQVLSVDPEFFCTSMTSNAYLSKRLDTTIAEVDDEIKADYGEMYIERLKHIFLTVFRWSSPKVDVVLDAMEAAVCAKYPADIYQPCRNIFTKMLFFTALRVPDFCKDVFIIIAYWLFKIKSGFDLRKEI